MEGYFFLQINLRRYQFGFLIVAIVSLIFPASVHAYAQHTTHPALAEESAKLFNLKNNDPKIKITSHQIELLRQGAIEEDQPPRWINHFYDPEKKRGWTGARFGYLSEQEGYGTAGWMSDRPALPSIEWVVNQEYQAAYPEQFGNQTWHRAIKYYLDGDEESAFIALGHSLHLIEDATVPDHTRNDSHPGIKGDPSSPYEEFAGEKSNYLDLHLAEDLARTTGTLPEFDSIQKIIESNAIYTHYNFFSEDTISNEEYTWPDLESLDREIKMVNGDYILFLKSNETYLAFLQNGKTKKFSTRDPSYVLPSYLSRLYPKAVISGAGALKLFFKEVEFYRTHPNLLPSIVEDKKISLLDKLLLVYDDPKKELGRTIEIPIIAKCSEIGDGYCTAVLNALDYAKNTTQAGVLWGLENIFEILKTAVNAGQEILAKNLTALTTFFNFSASTPPPTPDSTQVAKESVVVPFISNLPVTNSNITKTSTSTAPTPTTFKPPQGNLVLYPTTPKPLSTTIQPLVAATVRTPDPVVLGNGSLAKVTLSDSARSKQIVDSFNAYLEALHRLEQARPPGEAGALPTADDVRSVVGSAELRSAVDLVGKVTTQEQLSAQLSDSSTTPAAVAGLLLILSLSLSSWALSYEEARLQAERMRVLDKEASDFKVAALQAEEQAIKEALAKIVVPTPKLFRTDDWIDPNGKHFPVYGFVVNGVWHPVLDTGEVERLFGKGADTILPRVAYASYSFGWDPVHGGGTVGGAMTLRELWQMQAAVIHDGTLPATPEQYARGERGTRHPLGWTFTPSQMYNPSDKTIYIVDRSSMGRFNDILGWTAISTDTPKINISTLAFDTPEAFLNKTPWDKEITLRNLEYQPNQTYHAPVTTDFEKYFKEERAKGRTTEDIYQHNPFQVVSVPNQTNSGQTTSAPTTSVPLATPTWIIPFRSGLTKKQQDSITTLLNNRYQSHTTLNETDAQNYAFAIGEVNVGRFVGRYAEQISTRI